MPTGSSVVALAPTTPRTASASPKEPSSPKPGGGFQDALTAARGKNRSQDAEETKKAGEKKTPAKSVRAAKAKTGKSIKGKPVPASNDTDENEADQVTAKTPPQEPDQTTDATSHNDPDKPVVDPKAAHQQPPTPQAAAPVPPPPQPSPAPPAQAALSVAEAPQPTPLPKAIAKPLDKSAVTASDKGEPTAPTSSHETPSDANPALQDPASQDAPAKGAVPATDPKLPSANPQHPRLTDSIDAVADTANPTPAITAKVPPVPSASAPDSDPTANFDEQFNDAVKAITGDDNTPDTKAATAAPLTSNLAPPATAPPLATSSKPAAPIAAAATPALADSQIVQANHDHIITSIRSELLPKGGTMQMRLDPPELGTMQVQISVHDGVMTASFQTNNDQATRMLSHSLDQLKQSLETQGISVGKLQVQQAPRDHQTPGQKEDGGQQSQQQDASTRQEQQRREILQRMWRRLRGGTDPLDLVA